VSLTEEPEFEIPVAKVLAERYSNRSTHDFIEPINFDLPYNPYDHKKRETFAVNNIGGKNVPVVITDLSHLDAIKPAHLFGAGYSYNIQDDKWNIKEQAVDYIYTGEQATGFGLPGTLSVICDAEVWDNQNQTYPIFGDLDAFKSATKKSNKLNFVCIDASNLESASDIDDTVVFVAFSSNYHQMAEKRRFFVELMHKNVKNPVVNFGTYEDLDNESFQLYSSTDFGALFIDGFSDGIWIKTENCSTLQLNTSTAFGILQATRTRISKTDYISCPSCGRTLFDLQETTAKIRAKTNHLKGLKIGIMGCIVNGPGEMADADYGYVGVGKGKINLYKEREVVKKNIAEVEAVDELVNLIKEYGDWVEVKLD
jgi:(E)-4-hydroxy-3-methylbut-2-enyl-diphosphate synthase